MQLDLFSDNRHTILMNEAGEMLEALDLEKALAIYADLLKDAPGDRTILQLQSSAREWRDNLSVFHGLPVGSGPLHDLWLKLTDDTPPPLAAGVLRLVIGGLKKLHGPELIYIHPRFHIGTLLLAQERYAEAETWLARALDGGIDERARFLGWRGDALMSLGDTGKARECWLAAFLEGPRSVDLPSLNSRLIHNLLISLESERGDEIDEDEMVCWLPVWGWLQGEFVLSMEEVAADHGAFAASLEKSVGSRGMTAPRLWFEYLRYAEYLRTVFRNDRELVRARRRMRDMNGFMFDRYMEKVRGLALTAHKPRNMPK
jgi:tetratricopeptide (TPR) repeat protein